MPSAVKNVCIVEADDLLRALLRDAFEKKGCVVSAFADAESALSFLWDNPIVSVLVTDVGSTGKGVNFIRSVRQIPGYARVSVFYHSSHTPNSFETLTGTNVDDLPGNAGFIEKREDPEKVAKAILDILDDVPVDRGETMA